MNSTVLHIFETAVRYAALGIELIGLLTVVGAVARAVYAQLTHNRRVRLDLAEGIALALEFKLGAELLRTLIVHELSDLLIIGAVVVLRAAMTFLIQWEIHLEKKHEKEETEAEKAE